MVSLWCSGAVMSTDSAMGWRQVWPPVHIEPQPLKHFVEDDYFVCAFGASSLARFGKSH